MARWYSLEVSKASFSPNRSLIVVGRDACVVIWSMIKQKLFQPPIPRFLEGPVRSVAWVDFGLGPGNAFVSGHSDGRVVVYSRSKDQVRARCHPPPYLSTCLVQQQFKAISVKYTGHHLGVWDLRWDNFRAHLASTGGGMCVVWRISKSGEQCSKEPATHLTLKQVL
jgi:WD40 repeat protein